MEINGLTHEELEQLSDIDGYGKWQKIERYYPETRYVPDTGSKLKTGDIALRRNRVAFPFSTERGKLRILPTAPLPSRGYMFPIRWK